MFVVDDLLFAPFKGLLWVLKEVNHAVQQEQAGEHDEITRSLSELYLKLEAGEITEEHFEAEEKRLLDRLDAIALRDQSGEDDSDADRIDSDDDDHSSSDAPAQPARRPP